MRKKKVVIALSGGVDSSVAAFFLKKKGFLVEGVYMRFWKIKQAEKRAKKICSVLEIPFHLIDLRKAFKKKIIDYFLKEYKQGRTPNPCVLCNKEMKFKVLFDKMKELKADFVATGHYALVEKGKLFRAKCKERDQSYFLWKLDNLDKIIFPLGNYDKKRVREVAEKIGLPSSDIKDSQEVCFIEKTTFDFLKKNLKQKKGDIVNQKGDKLGSHLGLWFYTIGQRKRIGLASGPYYVIGKDVKKNLLIVSKDNLKEKEVRFEKVNWLVKIKFPFQAEAKIRHRSPLCSGSLYENRFIFDKAQKSITPGQSIVFYKKNQVLGGGVIK